MNKTVAFVTFAILAALGIIGTVFLLIFRPDATATFTGFIVNLLGIVTLAAGTFYGLGKAKQELESVKETTEIVRSQTNGTLSKLIADNKEKTEAGHKKDVRIAELEAMLLHAPIKGVNNND